MLSKSLNRLYFESVRSSKVPFLWLLGAVLAHVALFSLPIESHRPVRQEIVFEQGNAGIQVELLTDAAASMPSIVNMPVDSNDTSESRIPPPDQVSPNPDADFAQPASRLTESQQKARSVATTPVHPRDRRSTEGIDRPFTGSARAGTAIAQPASQVYTVQPPYPRAARELGIEGAVRLKVCVGPDGCPRRVQVTRSSGRSDFDLSSVNTVQRRWRFRPARTEDGRAVESTISVAIQFILKS